MVFQYLYGRVSKESLLWILVCSYVNIQKVCMHVGTEGQEGFGC